MLWIQSLGEKKIEKEASTQIGNERGTTLVSIPHWCIDLNSCVVV